METQETCFFFQLQDILSENISLYIIAYYNIIITLWLNNNCRFSIFLSDEEKNKW